MLQEAYADLGEIFVKSIKDTNGKEHFAWGAALLAMAWARKGSKRGHAKATQEMSHLALVHIRMALLGRALAQHRGDGGAAQAALPASPNRTSGHGEQNYVYLSETSGHQ